MKVQSANVGRARRRGPGHRQGDRRHAAGSRGRDGAWYEVTVSNASGKEVSGYIHNSVVEVLTGDEEEEEAPRPAARRPAPRYTATKEFARGGVKLMAGLSMGNLEFFRGHLRRGEEDLQDGIHGRPGLRERRQIAFELDLLYSPGGAVIKTTVDPASKSNRISGTAITLPIMLKVRFMPGTTPYILAGGEVGYILNQKVVITDADGVPPKLTRWTMSIV